MPAHRPAAAAALATAVGLLTALGTAGCGGSSGGGSAAGTGQDPAAVSAVPSSPGASGSASASASGSASSSAAAGLAVPGIPDPCSLLSASQIVKVAHLPASTRTGAVASATGGRSCQYNQGHPSQVTVSLTPVSKAGFDAFRQLAQGVTDLPGIGQEAYKSSQTPGVVDVYKNGFDLNVYVIHADTSDSASADAKALAVLLAAKVPSSS
jgi:hypothetical protein